ncbi:MAG: cell division protein SepF [Candidatus Thermoplasmatota archaeon]|nr:cell division protein SepF [Candidatus Thermoplasmatota archaeon]
MGLFSKTKSNNGSLAEQEFIDLRNHEAPETGGGLLNVRVAEMRRVEDLKALSGLVYEGDMLLVDVSAFSGDEVAMKRVTTEFKKIARDVGGDLAGIGSGTLIVAPTGVSVDRRKVRVAD